MKRTEFDRNVPSESRLFARDQLLQVCLRDDLHVTVPHNPPADVAAVWKTSMRDRVHDVRARPGQVMAAGVESASQEVRVKGENGKSRWHPTNFKTAAKRRASTPATLVDVNIASQWTEKQRIRSRS